MESFTVVSEKDVKTLNRAGFFEFYYQVLAEVGETDDYESINAIMAFLSDYGYGVLKDFHGLDRNITHEHLLEAHYEESLYAFADMVDYGLAPDDAIFAIYHGQWYYLDGIPTDNTDAAEYLYYHYNFYEEDSDPNEDIPVIKKAIDNGEWLLGYGKHKSIIISTF